MAPVQGGAGTAHATFKSFVEPCLLMLLHEEESHGYNLLSELETFGFDPEALDPSLVYRALREMESGGWVVSRWDTESLGPRRRVYTLTKQGEDRLLGWIEDLRNTRLEIERLEQRYHRHINEGG